MIFILANLFEFRRAAESDCSRYLNLWDHRCGYNGTIDYWLSAFAPHGRGAGVGRGLAVGGDLGVGVGRDVAVGVAVTEAAGVGLGVDVAVTVGVGLADGVEVAVGVREPA